MGNIIRLLLLLALPVTVVNCTTGSTLSQTPSPVPETIETTSTPEHVLDPVNDSPRDTPTIMEEIQQATALSTEEIVSTPESASNQVDKNISFINQIGGINQDIELRGDYAYMGVGPRLMVLDVSEPTNPSIMGQTTVFKGIVQNITIQNNMAYVVTPYSLYIIDMSDPATPVQLGSYAYDENFQNRAICVVENIAYITSDDTGLSIIDVSDPTDPKELGILVDSSLDVQVVNNLIYLAGEKLRILDISNPNQPDEISFYQPPERLKQIVIEDDFAYVDAFDKVRVLDISDPTNPIEVSSFKVDGAIFDIAVNNGLVYLSESGRKLHILDNTSPGEFREISTYELPQETRSLVVKDSLMEPNTYAYLGWGGIGILDVSQPDQSEEVGGLDMPGSVNDVAVIQKNGLSDQKAAEFLLGACQIGLCLVDVSDMATPFLVDSYSISSSDISHVKAVEDLAFVQVEPFAEDQKSLIIFDISTPSTLQEISVYPYSGQLEVVQQKAYIAAGRDGLHILDISNPSAPQLLGTYPAENWMSDIAVSGQTAYITDGGVQVIDISDPIEPKRISSYPAPEPVDLEALMLIQDVLYATGFRGGTQIIDITNSSNLKNVGLYNLTDWGPNSVQHTDTAYLYSRESLYMLDVSTPNQPSIIDSYELFTRITSIAVDQEKIYVATGASGIYILSTTR